MCLSCIHRWRSNPPENVFSIRHLVCVARINAVADAAKMVKHQSFWNLTFKQFVTEQVGTHPLHLKMKPSITFSPNTAHPNPARPQFGAMLWDRSVLVHVSPEIFQGVVVANSFHVSSRADFRSARAAAARTKSLLRIEQAICVSFWATQETQELPLLNWQMVAMLPVKPAPLS